MSDVPLILDGDCVEAQQARYYIAQVEDTSFPGDAAVTLWLQPGQEESMAVLHDGMKHLTIKPEPVGSLRDGDILDLWTYLEVHPEGPPAPKAYAVRRPRPVLTEEEREELKKLVAELEKSL